VALTAQNYQFILGARIKNENHSLQKEITNVQWKNGQTQTLSNDLLLPPFCLAISAGAPCLL
jgi:hypothetical protein